MLGAIGPLLGLDEIVPSLAAPLSASPLRAVCVFCGSRKGVDPRHAADAVWLAQRGAPANLGYVVGPHLTAAVLSLPSAAAGQIRAEVRGGYAGSGVILRDPVASPQLRQVPGIQGAAAMTGLPPVRLVNANDTDFEGYTAPAEGPFENVDYYQPVMNGYFETMGIPLLQGRDFARSDHAGAPSVAVVNEAFGTDLPPLVGEALQLTAEIERAVEQRLEIGG